MNTTGSNEIYDHLQVNGVDLIINTSFTFVLNTLLFLLCSYLQSISLAKQCVLLYLYKDFLIVLILCLTWIEGASSLMYACTLPIDWILATIIHFCLRVWNIVILLLANIITILKFRMNKEKMLDPSMPWGDDEKTGLMWIRTFCWVFSIATVTTMYICGIRSTHFHLLTGHDVEESMSYLDLLLNMVLLGTCALFIIGENYYQIINQGQGFDPTVSKNVKYLVFGFLLIILATMVGNISILAPAIPFKLTIWLRRKFIFIMLIIQIVIAVSIILKSDHIKSHVSKFVANILDQVFFLSIYLVPLFIFIVMHSTLYIIYHMVDSWAFGSSRLPTSI